MNGLIPSPSPKSVCLALAGLVCSGLLALQAADSGKAALTGKTLEGWRNTGDWRLAREVKPDPADPAKLIFSPGTGAYVNGEKGRTVNLVSQAEFGDVQMHIEFLISRQSNSGVYLMGRYEVQVYDSHGVEKDKYPGIECGGIYPRWTQERNEFEGHSPRVNASKPAGQWQSFDIVFRAPRFDASGRKTANARFVSVKHNGVLIHENVELTGPTRAATFEDEKALGPIMLQGDHGPVAYRNIRIQAARLSP
jgi:hypothetical protein